MPISLESGGDKTKMSAIIRIVRKVLLLIAFSFSINESESKSKYYGLELLSAVPENGCFQDGFAFKDYENCGFYFICHRKNDGTFKRTSYECPDNTQFDEEAGSCSDKPCSSASKHPPLPKGWKCERNHKKHVHPEDCRRFYSCYWTGEYYTYKMHQCHSKTHGSTSWFNEALQSCTGGKICPQDKMRLPEGPGWVCKRASIRDHFPHPEDCTISYTCDRCDYVHWCVTLKKCPPGQIFSGKKKWKCVPGTCPVKETKVPEGWSCESEGQLIVHPEECDKFLKCLKCKDEKKGEWCYESIVSCPKGQTFDNNQKSCVKGRCPQYPAIVPPAWKEFCDFEGDNNVNPTQCSEYFTCIACPDSSSWCYTLQVCPDGQTFDDTNKVCVDGRCPQLPPPVPPGITCSSEGEKHVNPEDCSSHYECKKVKGEWTVDEMQCPSGHTFDNTKKICVPGRCPQHPKELPKGWTCDENGEKRPHPDDCTQYYSCIRVEDKGDPYWSYELHQCPNGQNFDDAKDVCVDGRCPQLPPPLPPGWTCSKDGMLSVHPEDCTQFYKCIKLSKSEWTYEVKKCSSARPVFDDTKKACVAGRCPQWPPKLPAGFNCDGQKNGTLQVHPSNCNQYFTCTKCPDGGWCYVDLETCPKDHNFDKKKKKCVKGWCPQDPTTTPKPKRPPPPPPSPPGTTTSRSGETFNCPKAGRFPDKKCNRYWECWEKDDHMWATLYTCGPNMAYVRRRKACYFGFCSFF